MPVLSDSHYARAQQVRSRMKRVIATLEPVGGISTYGVFARKAFEVADQHGIVFSKKAQQKDTTSSVRRFVEGKQSTYGRRLDVFEMTCIAFENEAKAAKNGKHDGDEPPETLPKFRALKGEGEEVFPVKASAMNRQIEDDDEVISEIRALQALATALEPLDPAARKRVLQWAVDKFDLQSTVIVRWPTEAPHA